MLKITTIEPADLYFEDLPEGHEFPTVAKGPMMVGHQVRWAGACDNYESEFHHDVYVAKAAGLPGILLSGPLMASYLLVEVTRWTGRNARLVRFFDQNRGSTLPRDTAFLSARVKRAYQENGKAFIELDCKITNQKGEVTTPGSALVEIARRATAQ
jgi:acyl dehydratase